MKACRNRKLFRLISGAVALLALLGLTGRALGQVTNLALNKPATQSSTLGPYSGYPFSVPNGFLPGFAVDGDRNTFSHTLSDAQAWWQVDLGSVDSIQTINVWNRADCCQDRLSAFYVFVSDVAFVSTDLSTTLSQAGVSSYYTAGPAGFPTAISVNRTGRYVRVQLSGTNYLHPAEVEVLGTISGNPAPTVASITPTSGPSTGGTAVTITGANFQAGATVSLGGVAATGVVVTPPNITATTGAHAPGAVNVVVTNPDSQSGTLSNGFTYVCPAITVSPATLPNGTVGVAYSQTVTASGGSSPYTFSLASGTLPSGLTLSASGVISGTPSASGTSTFSVQAVDAQGCVGVQSYQLTVTGGAPFPSGELTEGNASSWGSFAPIDNAATSVTNDTTHVKVGSYSIKFVTASGYDTGVKYPAAGNAHWDLTGANLLMFWIYAINTTANGFQGNQPVIVLKTATGDIRYEPPSVFMFNNAWHLYVVALQGDSYWVRTTTGSPNLGDVLQLEIHHDTWDAGFTLYYDGLQFLAALPGELTEGNASSWGSFAPVDNAATSVMDDATHVRVGSYSIKFVTASGYDTGVKYPAAGNAHWDLSGQDSLTFWIYALNDNSGGFQGNQPVVILKTSGGNFRYEAQGTLMWIGSWRFYQVPLAGGGPWVRTATGSPTLSDVNQFEIHHDTWGAGFTLYFDGLGFGSILPGPSTPTVTSINPASGPTSGGTAVTITGTNFQTGAAVSLGGVAATGVTVTSSTTITATTGAHAAGSVNVVVTNPDTQTGTLTNGFTYVVAAAPTVSSINPTAGPTLGGTAVTITGTNFQTGAIVSLGGVAATGVAVTPPTTITATTGAHGAGAVNVVVTNPDSQSGTLTNGFTYVCPTIVLLPATLAQGTAGASYNQTVTASGGMSPYTFSLASGTLPSGLTLSASGLISGTPTTAGSFSFSIRATDAQGCTAAQGYQLTVTAGVASKLAFGTEPSSAVVGSPIRPPVTVQILDAAGNQTVSSASVTVAIGANPGGGTLSGTLTVAAVAGVATFGNLSIDKTGTGYTLTAASTGLTGATSSSFNIITAGAATQILVETAADGSGTAVPAQTITSGNSLTVYAISRDASNNFVANIQPDYWSLVNITGGVVAADLAATSSIIEFTAPWYAYDITAGPDGNLWFSGDDIGRITPAGAITEFPVPTSGGLPYGISAGLDGNLWFTELSGNKIGKITPAGSVTEFTVPTASSQPRAITAGPDGNLWFTEYAANKIGRITPDGIITEFPVPTTSSSPWGIVAGPDGNLWFTENVGNKIGRITPAGVITEFLLPTTLGYPHGIAAGPDGNLWFTENLSNKIGRITSAGVITEFLVPTDSSGPEGIVAGPDGNLWFTESRTGQIGRITPAGVFAEFPAPSSRLSGIAAGRDGNIWFTDSHGYVGRKDLSIVAAASTTFTAHQPGTAAIHAAKAGLTSIDSGTLTVVAGTASKLAFGAQPTNTVAGSSITPAVTVRILDANGYLTDSTAPVTMAIGANPGGGTLSGTLTVTAVAGVATFSNLSIDKAGTGYTLAASSAGLLAATGSSFDISAGTAAKILVETAADGSGTVVSPQNVISGNSLIVYAISRDANNNFVGNVQPDSWSLVNIAGGVIVGDLVAGEGFAEFPVPLPQEHYVQSPRAIAAGPDGNIWFTQGDMGNIKIGRVSPDGYVSEFYFGFCNGGNCPTQDGIVAGADGNLWVADAAVDVYTPSGGHLGSYSPNDLDASGIAPGPDGNVWFTEPLFNKIGRIMPGPAGIFTEFTIPTAGSVPWGIAAGPDGNVWFTETAVNKIGRITPSGVITEFPIPSGNVAGYGITAGPDGNLWFTGGSRIGRITPAGVVTELPMPTIYGASDIAAGPDGNLWFTGGAGDNIGRITPSGFINEFPVPTASSGAWHIVEGPDGKLWFTESLVSKIGRVSSKIGSATFTGHQVGTAAIHAAKAGLTSTDSGTLTVVSVAAAISGVSVSPSSVVGGNPVTGTVTLTAAAPTGGAVVALSSTNTSAATVPASVTVPAGAISGIFTVTTLSVASSTSVMISATYLDVPETAALSVMPTPPTLSSVTFSPTSVVGGTSATGTVTLTAPAPDGGVEVVLIRSCPNHSLQCGPVTVPVSVIVPAGAASGTFTVTTVSVNMSIPTLTAALYLRVIKTATLTVTPASGPALSSVTVSPTSVVGGSSSTGTATLTAAAPAGGAVVTLSSSNTSVAMVPPSVTVPEAGTSATFTVTTFPVATTTSVTITASYNSVNVTATLTVTVTPAVLTSLSLNPTVLSAGTNSAGTVTLTSAAPAGGTLIALSSSGPAATVPASVTVPSGATSATFTVTTSAVLSVTTVTITATQGQISMTASLTINPAPLLNGLAPGAVLPGDSSLVLYGTGFDSGSSVSLFGPVYALTDTTLSSPLCDLPGGACPETSLAASLGTGTLAFAVPSSASTGYYWVRARSSSTTYSSNGMWLKVEQAQKTYPVVPPNQHGSAPRIYSGQTVTGTFAAGGDTTGTFADYNMYYFFGTAGSAVNVSLQRVDTSTSWEDPSSVDPQLDIVAPDGVVYANLHKTDDQPGVDYNASLTGAVLPLTGIYYIQAETTKGSGDYTLSFAMPTVAPAPPASRVISFAGNFGTVPVNGLVAPMAFLLDPRGYTISGANVNFAVTPSSDDHGSVQFVGPSTDVTKPDGYATVTAQLTAIGRVQLSASLTDSVLAQWALAQEEGIQTSKMAAVPRYAPAATLPIVATGLDAEGRVHFAAGARQEIPTWEPKPPVKRQGRGGQAVTPDAKARSEGMSIGASAAANVAAATAESSAPRPLSTPAGILAAETLSSCGAAAFVEAGVNAAAVNPPFTVTLTDETPSTGQSVPNGVVDSAGIHGHRIQKTIRLKIDIKDAGGSAPNYPVLVHLASGGPHHGTLILDPDGNQVQCDQGSFLWHERDASGNIIALNEEFEYQLGTYAPYVGTVPDLANPGQVKPVWGTAEVLGLVVGAVDNQNVLHQSLFQYRVHPEPGKPDHFAQLFGAVPDPIFEFWSDAFSPLYGPVYTSNAYYLVDQYSNVTFGYTNTTPPPPSPADGVSVTFRGQTGGGSLPSFAGVDYAAYELGLQWPRVPNGTPPPPQGSMTTTASVTYPADPDWAGGTVSKTVPLQFDRGTFHSLVGIIGGYDGVMLANPGPVEDPDFPITVSPGSEGDELPRVVPPTDTAYVGLPARAAFVIYTNTSGPVYWSPGPNPGDPALDSWAELSDSPAFKVSLIDRNNQVAQDAVFQVHLCPRIDHQYRNAPRPCTLTPVQSQNGVVASVRVNPNGPGAADSRAYMGIELLHAPANPGNYFIKFETLEGRQYHIRELSQLITDYSPAGEYQGAFNFVTVQGGEFLDESFRHIDPFVVDQDTTAYFRYIDNGSGPPPATVTVKSDATSNPSQTDSITVGLTRVGQSNTYMTGPFTLHPPDAVPPAGMTPLRKTQTQTVLGVFAPQFQLKGFFVTRQVAQANGLVNALPIKVELFYRGAGPPTPQQWTVLTPGDRAYLGDSLRLTADLPAGWAAPTSYGWSFEVDGRSYVPPGTDPNAQVTIVDPVQRAGPWKIKLKVFWGTTERDYERPLDVWFESEPTAAIAWVDPRLIDTTSYQGTTGSTAGDCNKVFELVVGVLIHLVNLQFPPPPPDAERPFYNAATLKCVGPSPLDVIDTPGFDTYADFRSYVNFQGGINFKAASAAYMRAPVRFGEFVPTQVLNRTSTALTGRTEAQIPQNFYGVQAGTLFTFASQLAPENGTVRANKYFELTPTLYWLNKGRIGPPGQAFACFINTGLPACDLTHVVPYIWSKLIFTPESPLLRRNLQRTNTSFSTFRFYTPTQRGDGLRQYPLIRDGNLMQQADDPNTFLQNPEDSDVEQ